MEPLNLDTLQHSLQVEGYDMTEPVGWLEESYRNPRDFFLALMDAHNKRFGVSGKSVPFGQYDFYYDIIEKNRRSSFPAMVLYDGAGSCREVSYDMLGARVDRIARMGVNAGVGPGDTVCVVLEFGTDYVASVLAALKVGAVVSCIPPEGPEIVTACLQELSPDQIWTDALYQPLVDGASQVVIRIGDDMDNRRETDVQNRSHSYGTGTPAARLFDPVCDTPFTPVVVGADDIWLGALRDGLVSLGLKPGTVCSAPGWDPMIMQPSLSLSVLMAGATLLHVAGDDVELWCEALSGVPVSVLGVTRKLRDWLLERKEAIPLATGFWFRDPSGPMDFNLWYRFVTVSGLDRIYGGTQLWNAARGGCRLFSRKRKAQALQSVMPVAGTQWGLNDPTGTGQPSETGFGIFAPIPLAGEEVADSPSSSVLLAQGSGEWVYSGNRFPLKEGRFYPAGAVLKVVRRLPYCKRSVMITCPQPGIGDRGCFHLLVFTCGDTERSPEEIKTAIRTLINKEMGALYCPDSIRVYPIHPRYGEDLDVDEAWCEFNHISGGLSRKSNDELFLLLSRMKTFILNRDE